MQELNELKFDLQLKSDILKLIELQKFDENQKEQIQSQLEQLIAYIKKNQTLNVSSVKEFFIRTNQIQKDFFKIQRIQFNVIENSSVKMQEKCNSIAINDKGDTVLVGQNQKIVVFEFNNQTLSQKQTLNGSNWCVNSVIFFKKQYKFVSEDKQDLKIWTQDKKKQWSITQILKGHSSWIQSIIINKNDNLIASGSDDKSIKFWFMKGKQWMNTQTIKAPQAVVYSLCFNPSENLLISSGADSLIVIIEKKSDDWVVIQQIKTDQFGYKLSFLSDQLFVFQPDSSQFLIFYKKNIQNQQELTKFKEFQINRVNLIRIIYFLNIIVKIWMLFNNFKRLIRK